MDIKFDKKLSLQVLKEDRTQIAGYLYRYKKCVEKQLYRTTNQIIFDYFDEKSKNGVYSVKLFIKIGNTIQTSISDSFYIKDGMMVYIKRKIIAESENYLLDYYSQNSKILFITFNGTKSNKYTTPFGVDFIIKNGWDCIAVHQDNDTQYQSLSEECLGNILSPYIKNRRVFTYGSSLGGYCAVYYGGVLNATVIAASPKNSAHPSIRIKRFTELDFEHKNISETSKTAQNIYIVYDPSLPEDANFIKNQILCHYPCTKLLPVAQGTHVVLNRVLQVRLLKDLINSIVKGDYFTVYNKIIVANHLQNRVNN